MWLSVAARSLEFLNIDVAILPLGLVYAHNMMTRLRGCNGFLSYYGYSSCAFTMTPPVPCTLTTCIAEGYEGADLLYVISCKLCSVPEPGSALAGSTWNRSLPATSNRSTHVGYTHLVNMLSSGVLIMGNRALKFWIAGSEVLHNLLSSLVISNHLCSVDFLPLTSLDALGEVPAGIVVIPV